MAKLTLKQKRAVRRYYQVYMAYESRKLAYPLKASSVSIDVWLPTMHEMAVTGGLGYSRRH